MGIFSGIGKIIKSAFGTKEKAKLESEEYDTSKLLFGLSHVKDAIDPRFGRLTDWNYILGTLREALNNDKEIIKIAKNLSKKLKSKEQLEILESTENMFKQIRKILAAFIRMDRLNHRNRNKVFDVKEFELEQSKFEELRNELQKLIDVTKRLQSLEKSR